MEEMKKPIPADYKIDYFVHEDDMNKLDQSHRRVEKWMFILCLVIFIAFVGTNIAWVCYENSFQDVVVTESTQDGSGINLMNNGSGDLSYGAEKQDSKNESQEKR